MKNGTKLFLTILACIIGLVSGVSGQSKDDSARNSIGVRIGYSLSAGDWNKSRVAPDVSLFKGSFTFGGDLEFRLSERLTLAIDGGYGPLNGSDWETYTAGTGDTVSVSASIGYAGILLRPYLKISGPDLIRLQVGPVMLFASGHETVNGRTYNDDFFRSVKFGGEGGIEYDRMLGDNVAASLNVAAIVIPSGVEYADGESRTVIALPVTLGVRFYY